MAAGPARRESHRTYLPRYVPNPAGAIKELISNAYDAGATYAKIHTGFPRFTTFSCEDDGTGISKPKFIQLMQGGIGDSDKQVTANIQTGKNGRPVVGRLGVGLLSLAQICSRFSIRSFHESTKTAFEAEIKFPPYSRQELDQIVSTARKDPAKIIRHGEYRCVDILPIRMDQAPTRWGRINFNLVNKPESKSVVATVELARAGAPKQLHVKLRLPLQNAVNAVTVNGKAGVIGGLCNDTVIIQTGNDKHFEIVGRYRG